MAQAALVAVQELWLRPQAVQTCPDFDDRPNGLDCGGLSRRFGTATSAAGGITLTAHGYTKAVADKAATAVHMLRKAAIFVRANEVDGYAKHLECCGDVSSATALV
jgi:uncharacterized RmlC-like cupin family protein